MVAGYPKITNLPVNRLQRFRSLHFGMCEVCAHKIQNIHKRTHYANNHYKGENYWGQKNSNCIGQTYFQSDVVMRMQMKT